VLKLINSLKTKDYVNWGFNKTLNQKYINNTKTNLGEVIFFEVKSLFKFFLKNKYIFEYLFYTSKINNKYTFKNNNSTRLSKVFKNLNPKPFSFFLKKSLLGFQRFSKKKKNSSNNAVDIKF
jgi:gamma-glutamylcysteine synthetase